MLVILTIILLIPAAAAASYFCYRLAFSVPEQSREALFEMPDTEQYAPYSAEARQMISDALEIPYKEAVVTSYDGLRLFGKCYIASADAPWLIMLHGYRSGAERDFCGGLKFGIDSGFNVLLVDQRAHGKSEGKCLTFGIKERYDCLTWINYVISQAGGSCKIALYGMSMGAATVLMAAGSGLPKNVACIVADCGYTSPKAIIKKVIREMHYPVFPTYALVRLGGMLFGGFDIEEYSAVQAMEKCDIPVLFIHGDDDRFVPCDMSRENHRHCGAEGKKLLIIPNAGHGMSYMSDKRAYLGTVSEFLKSAFEG